MRRILHARAYDALLSGGGEALRAWSRLGEVVVLSGTRSAADEFIRDHAGVGVLGVHRFTLAQFAATLAARAIAQRGLCMVSQLGTEAIAARVVHQLVGAGRLEYFHPVARTPGFARVLARTLLELRFQGVAAKSLEKAGRPGADLARLLLGYANELAARSLADLPMVFELAAQACYGSATDERSALSVADLPLAFEPAAQARRILCLDLKVSHLLEERFLSAVARGAPDVLAVQLSGDNDGLKRWEQILGVGAEALPASVETNSLERSRQWLFSSQAPSVQAPDGTVDFFSAPGEELECVEIARRLQQSGRPFDQAAIVLRDPDRYQPIVEEALRRASIPAYFTQGVSRPDSGGRAFLALLACASEGCSATRFAEYLSLGQVPVLDAIKDDEREEARLAVPAHWERLLVDAAVIGGADRWERRLRGLEEEFRLQGADERRLKELANLSVFALPLIRQLSALPKLAHWGQWLDALAALAGSALRSPASVLSVLTELQPMDLAGPVELTEVAGVLEERLRFFRREPEGRRYGKVLVCSIEEIRARSVPIVFLPGLAEGVFPRRAMENPLLLDIYRIRLDAGLAVRDDLVADERLLLSSALAAARYKLIVSFPSMDTALARPRVPSFYALEVMRAVEGKLPGLAEFKRMAASAGMRFRWPAPVDPGLAIDDAEYDLAALKPAIDGHAEGRGAARYLVEVNPHLARSLRMRWKRWDARWHDADGLILQDGADRAVLSRRRLNSQPHSASSLQQFAQCPYRFALQSIFHLRPREEATPLDQMDPLTRGALFHRAQYEAYRQWPVTLDAADQMFTAVAEEFREKLAPAIPRVWNAEIEDLRTDFRAWLRDVSIADADWEPWRFEYGFGLRKDASNAHDPASSAEAATITDGFLVRGSMDLVQRHKTTGALRVVDHKTGKAPERAPVFVGGGEVLQPLLYALSGESLWGQPVGWGRLFYCTQRGGYRRVDIAVTAQARERLLEVLHTIDDAVEGGFLPAAPAKDACGRCDYRAVCGPHEEERVGRKQAARLEPLMTVRALP